MDLHTRGENQERERDNFDSIMRNLYFNKYRPTKKLGEGSFGMIYKAENIITKEVFALKFEDRHSGQNLLESEAYVMGYLKGSGIPLVKSYGYSGDYNILVMELLGKSLEDLMTSSQDKKFSIKCVCMLAIQMLTVLEQIHSKHIIHRDIKPDNFVMGLGENEKLVYLLDFGLARKYRSSTTFQHYPMRDRKKLTGTARYASINALKGLEQSRRDDLEAVGYVLMYFLRGSLPWQGLPVKAKEDRYKKIMEKKGSTSPEDLCFGFPEEFATYIKYCRNLRYEEDPDYTYMKDLFNNVMWKKGFSFDYHYDWSLNVENGLSNNTGNNMNTQNSILNNYLNSRAEMMRNNNTTYNNPINNRSNLNDTPVITNPIVNNLVTHPVQMQVINTSPNLNLNLLTDTNNNNMNTLQAQRHDDSNNHNHLITNTNTNILQRPQTSHLHTQINKSSIKVDMTSTSLVGPPMRKSKKESKCCIY